MPRNVVSMIRSYTSFMCWRSANADQCVSTTKYSLTCTLQVLTHRKLARSPVSWNLYAGSILEIVWVSSTSICPTNIACDHLLYTSFSIKITNHDISGSNGPPSARYQVKKADRLCLQLSRQTQDGTLLARGDTQRHLVFPASIPMPLSRRAADDNFAPGYVSTSFRLMSCHYHPPNCILISRITMPQLFYDAQAPLTLPLK